MGTDFTGTDAWVATITGPTNGDDATGDSVSDMGVQLANRTTYLGARIDDAYQRRLIDRRENKDLDSDYTLYGSAVTSATWVNHSAMWFSSVTLPESGFLVLEFQGFASNANDNFSEIRLTAGGDHGPHARVNATSGNHVHIVHAVAPGGSAQTSPVSNVGLQLRTEDAGGAISILGWARLDIWHLAKVSI